MSKNYGILITGYLRSFEKNFKYIKKLFKNFDLFVYTIDTQEHYEIAKRLGIKNLELVKDSDINMGDFTLYNKLFKNSLAVNIDTKIKRDNTGWLKQLLDYKHGINYLTNTTKREHDFIVRYRPDLKPVRINKINFKEDKFNCFQQNLYKHQINDKFFLSNKNIMTKFMINIFDALKDKNITKYKNEIFNVEQFLYSFLAKENIKINWISKKELKFKKVTQNKTLSAGFDEYPSGSIRNAIYD